MAFSNEVTRQTARQSHGVYIDIDKIPSITPLIAKIAVFWIFYMINQNEILKIKEFNKLVDHAIGKCELDSIKLNEIQAQQEKVFYKYHGINITIEENLILMAITFFGYLRWLFWLGTDMPIETRDEEGRIIENIQLRLDFKNTANTIAMAQIKSKSHG